MKKQIYIIRRIRYYAMLWIAYMALLGGMIGLAVFGFLSNRAILIVFLVATGVLVQYGYKHIYRLLMQNNKTKQFFAQGKSYEDIYQMEYPLSVQEQEMFQRFAILMDKNKLINASKKSAEYLALQNQINPHFLYNTLEGIRAEALLSGADSIAEMTEALATYFQYTISKMENRVTLEEELTNVENYYYIQQFRFGNRLKLNISYDCEDEDRVLNCLMPKLTLQPIVENSIYHGLEQKVGCGNLNIRITMTEQNLIIMVADDGVGMEKEKVKELNWRLRSLSMENEAAESEKGGNGIAMQNVNNRIKLLFGEKYGIYIYSQLGEGTDVEITLPVEMGE